MVRYHEPEWSAGYRLGKHKSAETSGVWFTPDSDQAADIA